MLCCGHSGHDHQGCVVGRDDRQVPHTAQRGHGFWDTRFRSKIMSRAGVMISIS